MPNQEGVYSKLDYQESPGVNRTAWLTEAKMELLGVKDSWWMVEVVGTGHVGGPHRWLTYLGTDGGGWRSRVVCEGHTESNGGKWIATIFEEQTTRKRGTKRRKFFGTVDWDGSKWKVEILDVLNEKGQPQLRLSRG